MPEFLVTAMETAANLAAVLGIPVCVLFLLGRKAFRESKVVGPAGRTGIQSGVHEKRRVSQKGGPRWDWQEWR